jgi:acyl-CoA reductase-like NAD-dependent aldehyde dehydrogenase
MSGLNNELKIAKTIKLFIGGEFPRTESGRSVPVYLAKSKKIYANLCKASRKDLRNAVTAAQEAQKGWASRSAYNRTQILYRMAEMTEGKREEFIEVLTNTLGYTKIAANKAVDEAVDAFVYYAGFADKYQQMVGAVNPVSGPHHNFTSSEPVGIVALVCNSKFNLGNMVAQIAAIIASGNSVVTIMADEGAATLAPLSEVLATSDLPKGVVNLLTGDLAELHSHLGTHMEINSLSYQGTNKKVLGELKEMAAGNMKRVIPLIAQKDMLSLDHLINYVEFKTVWHPIGN